MRPKIKNCQNCKKNFRIEPEDFMFYDKIKVPPPTFCPECRMVRRMLWRNEKKLYRRKCDLTGRDTFSIYAPESSYKVYDAKEWFGDGWDPMEYGRDYDFSRPFFKQFAELLWDVPRMSLVIDYPTMINSPYMNQAANAKNCYLVTNSDYCENCAYGTSLNNSREAFDSQLGEQLELTYETLNCRTCQKTYFSEDCESCIEVWFSKNLSGCSYCIGCTNLRNKQYHIFNRPYSREEYQKKLKEFQFGSFSKLAQFRSDVLQEWLRYPQKHLHGVQNVNVVGEYTYNSKNSYWCNEAIGMEDSKYCQLINAENSKDCYDYTEWGNGAELVYECVTTGEGVHSVKFSHLIWPNSRNVEYSSQCVRSSNLFGCVGLKNKQNCIFNKQYSEEEFNSLREQIIQQMKEISYIDARGHKFSYGEFFPAELSPFAYNESTAHEYVPLTKVAAEERGYRWRDEDIRNVSVTAPHSTLPDTIADVGDDILQKIVGCAHEGRCADGCTVGFKIIPMELAFLKKSGIPLPRLCPTCRHVARMQRRTEMKFWHRSCMCAGAQDDNTKYQNTVEHQHGTEHCPNEFETAYSPERKEIIYCEPCYNSEIL